MSGKYDISVYMRSPGGRYIVKFPVQINGHNSETIGLYESTRYGNSDFFSRYGSDEIAWNCQTPRELRRLAHKTIKEYDRRVAMVTHLIQVEFVNMFGQFALVEAYLLELDFNDEAVRTLWHQCFDHIENEYDSNFLSADWNEYVRSAD